jgi:hypothetical protein
MSKIRPSRAGRNRAPNHPARFEWRQERERREQCAGSRAGRWIQRRVPGLSGALADAHAIANGLGVRHER